MLKDLLKKEGPCNLISYKGKSLTQAQFKGLVSDYVDLLKNVSINKDSFLLLENDEPLEFYPILFALWSENVKVVFPTRDILKGDNYNFYEQVLKFENEEFVLKDSKAFFYRVPTDEYSEIDTVVFSSGSTGTPKGICHKKENFLNNASAINSKVALSSYVSFTPLSPYLVSALSHFLVHYMSDSHLIFIDIDDVANINSVAECYGVSDFNFVGSPVHVMMAASAIDGKLKPPFFFTSGDFINSRSIEKIIKKFPETVFYKVYGLAELGGRFFVNKIDKTTEFVKYDSIGENISGTDYKVEEGQLFVSSDFLFYGYVKNSSFVESQKFHPTGDLIKENEGSISLYGRTNDEIKVGGNKVSLKSIENKIADILIDDIVVVVSEKHDLLGNLISLVIKSDKKHKRVDVMKLLSVTLPKNEMPHNYYSIDELPYTQSQKIDRNKILSDECELHKI